MWSLKGGGLPKEWSFKGGTSVSRRICIEHSLFVNVIHVFLGLGYSMHTRFSLCIFMFINP